MLLSCCKRGRPSWKYLRLHQSCDCWCSQSTPWHKLTLQGDVPVISQPFFALSSDQPLATGSGWTALALPKEWPQHQYRRVLYTPLAGCGAQCARSSPLCARGIRSSLAIRSLRPTYWMLSRWQRDDGLMCSLSSELSWFERAVLCFDKALPPTT